jgi:uncharacterized protein YukE
MPIWQPNWFDVRFDEARAEAAIDALRQCASVVDALAEQRASLARLAQTDWQGGARDRFDVELSRMMREASGLAAALRAAAGRIEVGRDEAHLEQARRSAERNEWWDEKRRDDAARAQQGLPPTPGPSGPLSGKQGPSGPLSGKQGPQRMRMRYL